MLADNITSLIACNNEDLAKNCKVFNLSKLDYYLWIYLNPEDVRDCYFLGAEEIGPQANNSQVYPDTFVQKSQCWIRVNTSYIDTRVDKHTIKLSFVNRITSTAFSLYASFYIQNDDPEKPYVYIKEKEENKGKPKQFFPETFTEYSGGTN